MKWTWQQLVRYLALTVLAVIGAAMVVIGLFVQQRLAHHEAFARFYPAKQVNTLWKTAEDDVVFLVGDSEADFQVFALWNGDYVAARLNCDYGQRAELSVPGTDGRDACLVFGKYDLSPDRFAIKVEEGSSSAAFAGGREEIVLRRFSRDEVEKDGELKALVMSVCQ